MPVFKRIRPETRPDWCAITSAGSFRIPVGGAFDNHYHEYDEYWFIAQGRALVRSEGIEYLVEPGDILCTQAGQDHDFVEVYEEIEGFWLESAAPEGARIGRLHHTEADAAGHSVTPTGGG
jgi:mannose-6-phosphate isomerase-like protein (cupin superfamily)